MTTLAAELMQIAETMRKRDWEVSAIEIGRLVARHGPVAAYDLGRIVGQLQLGQAVDLAARDGWDAEVALRSRAGKPTRWPCDDDEETT